MSNRVYDILAKTQRFLPAIGLFYLAIAKIWGFPFADEVNQTIAALATLLGTLLEISTAQYLKAMKKTTESFSDQNHIEGELMPKTRKAMIDTMNSLVGLNEKDGSFKVIIDTYNKLRPAGSYKMKYTDAWCACTVSTCALVNNMADIIPIDVSCGKMLEKAKKMGIWVENDAFVAQPGDIIMYDWGDSGKGDCIGWPDHVGLVVDTDGSIMTIVEGNKAERVGVRKLKYNSKNIRGFITPKYVDGVTQVPKPVKPIETAEYKARVTASALWVRAGASTKYGKVGCLRQNTIVQIYEVRNNWGRINKSANMWISLKYTAKL